MSVEQRIYDMTLVAARDLSAFQYRVMKGSGAFGCDLSGAVDECSIGILQNLPNAAGHEAEVRRVGISKGVCGADIPVWSKVTPDANGRLMVALTNERYIGFAMQVGAFGRVISILMEFGRVEEMS